MKCLRCGKEVPEGVNVCENCGYNVNEQKDFQKLKVEVDNELDKAHKTDPFDAPILTFIFGIISILNAILIVFGGFPIPIIYIIIAVVIFGLAFFFSTKPSRIKLKPVREFGIVLAYIGFTISIIFIAMWIISLIK